MEGLLAQYRALRAPEGAAGGSASGAGAAGAAGAGAAAGAAGTSATGAGATGAPAAGAGATGNGAAAGGAASADAPYRIDGFPDTMFGQNDRETIDKFGKALSGFRQKESQRGETIGAVPATPDAYKLEWSAPLKPYEAALNSDAFGKAFLGDVRKFAHEAGLGDKQLSGFLNKVMESMVVGGMVEPPFDAAKERAASVPEVAKGLPEAEQRSAVDKRMNDNLAWLEAMKRQGMQAEAADFLVAQLGDRANGHVALEFLRARAEGQGGAQPVAGGQYGTTDQDAALMARQADPRNDPMSPKHDKDFAADTLRLYQQRYGQ